MPVPIPYDQRPSRAASQGQRGSSAAQQGFSPQDFTKAGGCGASGTHQSQWIEPRQSSQHPSQAPGYGSASRHPSQAPSQGWEEPPRSSRRPSQARYGPGLSQAHGMSPAPQAQGTDISQIDPTQYPPGPIPGAFVPHSFGPNVQMPLYGGGRGVRQMQRLGFMQ